MGGTTLFGRSAATPSLSRLHEQHLRAALVTAGLFAAAVAMLEWAWIAEVEQPYGWLIQSFGLVGLATTAVGLWLWDRRPANRIGLRLTLVGATLIGAAAGNIPDRWLALPGVLLAEAPIAAVLHLVLAFPSGLVRDRLSKRLVVIGYVSSLVFQVPIYVFGGNPAAFDSLSVDGHTRLADLANDAQAVLTNGALIVAIVVLVRRWRTAAPTAERRVVGIVFAYGVVTLATFPITARILRPVFEWNPYLLFGCQLAIIAGVPFVFAAAMLSGALARTVDIGELASWLGAAPSLRPRPRDALARALGDPSLQLLYELPGTPGRFVDADGHGAELPPTGVVEVEGQQRRAVIVYDATLLADPGPVVRAARVAALAIDHERLTAELLASQAALQESRARIVEHGEAERRQLAQDLHDGVQGRLVVAALHAGRLAARLSDLDDPHGVAAATAMRDSLDGALTQLRHVVNGVLPPLLGEQGLFAALEGLGDELPIPCRFELRGDDRALSITVSSHAYFVASESIANALKHARSTELRVSAEVDADRLRLEIADDGVGAADAAGSGLRGIRDRVAALGGTFVLESPTNGGTRVKVELPCES